MPFEKGKSGNPRGRPKRKDAAAEKARKHVGDAVQVHVDIMLDKEASNADRLRAANTLIERGYGKPTEYVEFDGELNGQMDHGGLPALMDRIAADIQRERTDGDMPVSDPE